jgi:hypothetical protein
MWPKALAQLIEIAPHVTRLLPMADRFFQSKSAEQDASRSAMEQMAEGLRGDLGQVTASHAGLYRQLNDQSEKLAVLGLDVKANKLLLESAEARTILLEKQVKVLRTLLIFVLLFVVVILWLIILRK